MTILKRHLKIAIQMNTKRQKRVLIMDFSKKLVILMKASNYMKLTFKMEELALLMIFKNVRNMFVTVNINAHFMTFNQDK